jgi:glycosyltransferase involved in cell wall biosynthesis
VSGALRLGVDALNLLHDRRGIWRYTRALLRRWVREGQDRVHITLLVPHLWPRLVRRRLLDSLGVEAVEIRRRQDVAASRLHVVWYPWNGMSWISPCLNIATVHDVWPFASPAEDLHVRRSQQSPFQTTAANAHTILTDSQFSKSEIAKHLSVSPQHIRVIPLGVDPPRALPGPPLLLDGASRFVLFVGENEPRKDLATLLAAMARLPDALRMTTGLVVAGKPSAAVAARGRIDSGRHEGKPTRTLRFERHGDVPMLVTGEIGDAVLAQLYAGAAVFVFPSRYEGFGLPVLEAMARGAPVIASNAASVPEVAGDAALYFPAGDAGALVDELTRVLGDRALAARLGAAGISRAAAFTWDRCADETLQAFEEAAHSDRRR